MREKLKRGILVISGLIIVLYVVPYLYMSWNGKYLDNGFVRLSWHEMEWFPSGMVVEDPSVSPSRADSEIGPMLTIYAPLVAIDRLIFHKGYNLPF